jgi:ActR/RegA family two-component response regulator
VTMFDDSASVLAAVRAGARGYLVKGADRDEIRAPSTRPQPARRSSARPPPSTWPRTWRHPGRRRRGPRSTG